MKVEDCMDCELFIRRNRKKEIGRSSITGSITYQCGVLVTRRGGYHSIHKIKICPKGKMNIVVGKILYRFCPSEDRHEYGRYYQYLRIGTRRTKPTWRCPGCGRTDYADTDNVLVKNALFK